MDTVNDFQSRIDTIVRDYKPQDIFNCDETGLFFRALPDKTLAQKKSACKGGKIAKERSTVMLCSAGLTKPGDLGDKVAFTALKSRQLGPKAKFQSPCYFETSPINFQ